MIALTRREVLLGLAGFSFTACRKTDGNGTLLLDGTTKRIEQVLVFTPEQRPTIDAVVETILPGAMGARVPDFIAYWLAKKPFESTRRFIMHGLKLLDQQAARQFKQRFDACDSNAQATILKAFSEGKYRTAQFNGALFFQQLVELTLEGYLSDPKYGGNYQRVGWQFIGIPDGLQSCWWNPSGVSEVLEK